MYTRQKPHSSLSSGLWDGYKARSQVVYRALTWSSHGYTNISRSLSCRDSRHHVMLRPYSSVRQHFATPPSHIGSGDNHDIYYCSCPTTYNMLFFHTEINKKLSEGNHNHVILALLLLSVARPLHYL